MSRPRTVKMWMMLVAAMAVLTAIAPADDKSAKEDAAKVKSPKKPAPGATAPAPVDSTQGLGSFGMLLPLGQKNLDVKIPSFKDGLPSSLIRAGSMTRLDDEYMEMEKLDIRLFGEAREKDVRVQLVTGEYHMPTQLLSSEQRSRISREDFQLEGDALIFDTKTQQGKMTGNVKMVIFDSSNFTGTKEAEPSTKAPPAEPPGDKVKNEPKDTKPNDKK